MTKLLRTVGAVAVLFSLIFASSSSYHLLEECAQEVVSHEVKLLPVRKEDEECGRVKSNDLWTGCCLQARPRNLITRTSRPIVSRFERNDMNGLGTYLLI